MAAHLLLCVATSLALSSAYVVLEDSEYIRLNDVNGEKTINASTSNRLAFDEEHDLLYVLAKEPRRLTTFVLHRDDTASQLMEIVFDGPLDGLPLDVELCNPRSAIGNPRLAISFEDPISASADGTVRLYEPLTRVSTELTLIKEVTVGPEPVDLEFGQDCSLLLVANRGRPTREGSVYRDPEGSVSKILTPFDLNSDSSIITSTITFGEYFTGDDLSDRLEDLRARNFRFYPLRIPGTSTLLDVAQNIEPERLVISPNGLVAYVSMPKNNAIARLHLQFNDIELFALTNRSWTDYHLDPSDTDNEVNLRSYNIYSLTQSTEMLWLEKAGQQWVVTLDTGRMTYEPTYNYADYERAATLMANGDIDVSDPELAAALQDDDELGRLYISTEDGKGPSGDLDTIFTFGGRGFGIRDATDFDTPSVVVDSIERATETYFPNVFNAAFTSNGTSPQQDAEATSPTLGPDLTAMAVGEFQGRTVLFLGGGSSGVLYVYMLSPDARCLQPYLHSVHRFGDTNQNWQALYDRGRMGDIGITDMLYIATDEIRPMVAVASAISNSVSMYRVAEDDFTH